MLNRIRRYRWMWLGKRKLRSQIKKLGRKNKLKIIIGTGATDYDGWIATDLPFFDATKASDWSFFFQNREYL